MANEKRLKAQIVHVEGSREAIVYVGWPGEEITDEQRTDFLKTLESQISGLITQGKQ